MLDRESADRKATLREIYEDLEVALSAARVIMIASKSIHTAKVDQKINVPEKCESKCFFPSRSKWEKTRY